MLRPPLSVLFSLTALACQGFPGQKRVSVDQAQATLAKGNAFLLDVRTEEEFKGLHLKGTGALIPVQDLEKRLTELTMHKEKPILVLCRSGNRSQAAAQILVKAGFKDVADIEGGIKAWVAKGYPTAVGTVGTR